MIDPPIPERLVRRSFDTAQLVREHPPRWRNINKQRLHQQVCPPGTVHRGSIDYSRWRAVDATAVPTRHAVDERVHIGSFHYPPSDPATTRWHLNFAHRDLFSAYAGPAFAQDEIQVAEHPALASLREALVVEDDTPRTAEQDEPTPVLIMGVERHGAIATGIDPDAGRPLGLYGRRFARAEPEVVARAVRRLDPPPRTNIVAMRAPEGGSGRYRADEIESILRTATTGFAAARRASAGQAVVHTGFWGCGAHGGNRTLMALLQLLAARTAQLDALVFHTFDRAGAQPFAEAQAALAGLVDALGSDCETIPQHDLVDTIALMGLRWDAGSGH